MQAMPATALLLIDLQPDFLPGGALAVPDGDAIIPIANRLARAFSTVVLTQDWHPPGHRSFASAHPGRAPFETIRLPYGEQVLWPDHCLQATPGAALAPGLDVPHASLILRKGCNPEVDSYSAFTEADGTTTGLAAWLRARGITDVVLAGLATDYCVAWSALGARRAGFATTVVEDACRAIDLGNSLAQAWRDMAASGVARAASRDILA
jgi:nicotinamidase/pyrazinamidase